jgi:hypothetical protein
MATGQRRLLNTQVVRVSHRRSLRDEAHRASPWVIIGRELLRWHGICCSEEMLLGQSGSVRIAAIKPVSLPDREDTRPVVIDARRDERAR